MTKDRKTTAIRIVLFTATFISLFFVPWILVWAWIRPVPDTIDQQLNEALEYGFDGVIVYAQAGDQPAGFHAAGWHDRANKVPADPQALFKIASIDKLYTAVAITKLVAEGRLSLDETVADHFPELEGRIEYADRITLRMMVGHRSGIPNYTDTPDFWTDPPESSEEALGRILDQPADFEPDTKYAYCNTNYLLLTHIIEEVAGREKFDVIREVILTPLNLNDTYASLSEIDTTRLMSGYYVGIEDDIKTVDYGCMIATAEDVGIFLRALNDGTLLSSEEQDIYSSLYEYNHSGLVPGYQSIAEYHPEIDAVVVQFVNTTDFEGYEWNLSEIVHNRVVKIVGREE